MDLQNIFAGALKGFTSSPAFRPLMEKYFMDEEEEDPLTDFFTDETNQVLLQMDSPWAQKALVDRNFETLKGAPGMDVQEYSKNMPQLELDFPTNQQQMSLTGQPKQRTQDFQLDIETPFEQKPQPTEDSVLKDPAVTKDFEAQQILQQMFPQKPEEDKPLYTKKDLETANDIYKLEQLPQTIKDNERFITQPLSTDVEGDWVRVKENPAYQEDEETGLFAGMNAFEAANKAAGDDEYTERETSAYQKEYGFPPSELLQIDIEDKEKEVMGMNEDEFIGEMRDLASEDKDISNWAKAYTDTWGSFNEELFDVYELSPQTRAYNEAARIAEGGASEEEIRKFNNEWQDETGLGYYDIRPKDKPEEEQDPTVTSFQPEYNQMRERGNTKLQIARENEDVTVEMADELEEGYQRTVGDEGFWTGNWEEDLAKADERNWSDFQLEINMGRYEDSRKEKLDTDESGLVERDELAKRLPFLQKDDEEPSVAEEDVETLQDKQEKFVGWLEDGFLPVLAAEKAGVDREEAMARYQRTLEDESEEGISGANILDNRDKLERNIIDNKEPASNTFNAFSEGELGGLGKEDVLEMIEKQALLAELGERKGLWSEGFDLSLEDTNEVITAAKSYNREELQEIKDNIGEYVKKWFNLGDWADEYETEESGSWTVEGVASDLLKQLEKSDRTIQDEDYILDYLQNKGFTEEEANKILNQMRILSGNNQNQGWFNLDTLNQGLENTANTISPYLEKGAQAGSNVIKGLIDFESPRYTGTDEYQNMNMPALQGTPVDETDTPTLLELINSLWDKEE